MHLLILEVCHDDIYCRPIPFILEGRLVAWYPNFPINSMRGWRDLKNFFWKKI